MQLTFKTLQTLYSNVDYVFNMAYNMGGMGFMKIIRQSVCYQF